MVLIADSDGFREYTADPSEKQTVVIERLATGYGIAIVGPTATEPRSGCFIARSSRDGIKEGEFAVLLWCSFGGGGGVCGVWCVCPIPRRCASPTIVCVVASFASFTSLVPGNHQRFYHTRIPPGQRVLSINGIDGNNWNQEVRRPCGVLDAYLRVFWGIWNSKRHRVVYLIEPFLSTVIGMRQRRQSKHLRYYTGVGR